MTKKLIKVGNKIIKINSNLLSTGELPSEEGTYVFVVNGQIVQVNGDFVGIKIEPGAVEPSVTTSDATNISNDSATLGGNVTDDGGATVTERGIYLSETSDPKNSGVKHADGSGTGSFSSVYSGLDGNKTYYFVAYATNSKGTAYGVDKSFETAVDAPTTAPTITSVTFDSINDRYNVTATLVNDATYYQLYYYFTSGTEPTQQDIETNAFLVDQPGSIDEEENEVDFINTEYDDDGFGNRSNGWHCHIVRGCNTTGCGPWSTAHKEEIGNGGEG